MNIELPGGGSIKKYFSVKGTNNVFTFKGINYGDRDLEEDEKNDIKKFDKIANNRETIKFKFDIQIPCARIQVQAEEGKTINNVGKLIKYKFSKDKDLKDKEIKDNDSKGLITFEYNVIVFNQKKEAIDEDVIDFYLPNPH